LGIHLVISVGTQRAPSETRRVVLVQYEAFASLEEGIVNVKAIDPAYGAGLETITRGVAVATADGYRNKTTPSV
jgi:hypothetical protein